MRMRWEERKLPGSSRWDAKEVNISYDKRDNRRHLAPSFTIPSLSPLSSLLPSPCRPLNLLLGSIFRPATTYQVGKIRRKSRSTAHMLVGLNGVKEGKGGVGRPLRKPTSLLHGEILTSPSTSHS